MRVPLVIVSLLFSALFLQQCKVFDPAEQIPAYIHIDTITLNTNYDSFGSASHNIVDAWVFLDNKEFLGAFELPTTIPILAEGEHTLTIQAGIKENGIANTRIRYPFYDKNIYKLDMQPGKVDTLHPQMHYISQVRMLIDEDFEIPYQYIEKAPNNTVDVLRSTDDVFEKKYALKATLIDNGDVFEIQTINTYNVSRSLAMFLELNYKTDETIAIGYYSINVSDNTQHGFMYLNPTDTWKKIYVNLGTEMSLEPVGNVFRFFIGAQKSSDGDTTHIYLDNLKIVHFE